MPHAVGYVRVSTERQVQEGVSLAAQASRIRAWAQANGFELVALQEDAGISGGKADNRPGLQEAIAKACKHKAALVVYSLSRLARSTKDAISISERLEKGGADLVSLSERIDTTTASGKMVFRMLAVLAEFERDQVSERTKAALAHKKALHRRAGNIPYGYALGPDGDSLVPVQKEQDTIRLMRRLRSRGLSFRQLAAELERRGVPTKKGRGRWHFQIVRDVLRRSPHDQEEGPA